METTIRHAENFTVKTAPVPRYGYLQLAPGQSGSGYGRKISTDYMIQFHGEKTWRRVYAVCYSNAPSLYVVVKGEWQFVRDHDLRPDA